MKTEEKISKSINEELVSSYERIESLRLDSLELAGMAGDASAWLYSGECTTVGNRQNVFHVS